MENIIGDFDKKTKDILNTCIKSVIVNLQIIDNQLIITTPDSEIIIEDCAQFCCEERYFTCDDDLSLHINSRIIGFEMKQAESEDNHVGVHEINFLDVKTSRGCFQIAAHNEHNGYYGGFSIVASKGGK